MIDIEIRGYFANCPHCRRELRINGKYVGESVQCKHCSGGFVFELDDPTIETKALYTVCPYCENELRASRKYEGARVACKHCAGKIRIVSEVDTSA